MTATSSTDPNKVLLSGLFVHLTVGGRLFTAAELGIQKVTIIDVDEGDNTVEFSCLDHDFKIADSQFFKEGNILSIKWGYSTPQLSSAARSGYVIMKPSTDYSRDGVVSTVKAKTKGATLQAHRPAKSWGPTTLYRVMKDLVEPTGLTLVMTDRNEKVPGFAQGNMSTRLAMRVLAERYGYTITYESETVTVEPIDFGVAPSILLTYGRNGNIEKANVNNDTHSDGGEGSGATMLGHDPASKTPIKGEAKDDKKTVVGLSMLNAHAWLSQTSPTPQTPPAASSSAGTAGTPGALPQVASTPSWVQKTVGSLVGGATNKVMEGMDPEMVKMLRSTPDTVQGNIEAHATSSKLRAKKRKVGLSITSRGIVAAKARIIVEVRGLAKRDSGLWYVSQVTHEISLRDSNYTCEWEFNRHGKNTAGVPNPGTVNDKKTDTKNGSGTTGHGVVNVVNGSNGRTEK